MTKFVVLLCGSTAEQQMTLHTHFVSKKIHWWHWDAAVWLLVFSLVNVPKAEQLKEEIRQVLPQSNFLIFNLDSPQYAGRGPDEWRQWFDLNWR
jgi:hypothetical protein